MTERSAEVVGGHRIIQRPLRHSEYDDRYEHGHEQDKFDLDSHVRWECTECVAAVQGHEQAVDVELADTECPVGPDEPEAAE